MQCSPAFLSQLIYQKRLLILNFQKRILVYIFRIVLENIKKALQVFFLNGPQHFFALLIQILPDVKLSSCCFFLLILVLIFSDFLYFVPVLLLLEPEDVVEVPGVDAGHLRLFLWLELFEELDVQLHPLLQPIVRNTPAREEAVGDLALLDAGDEILGSLPHSLLQVI